MEKGADDMAANELNPAELWESSAARVNPTPMAVYWISQRGELLMAVAAGRVRYEHICCRLLEQFMGREAGRLSEGA